MSEIKVNSIKGVGASAAAITVNNTDGTCTANITSNGGGQLANRNKVINGAMTVSQRHGTSSVQLSASEQYIIDRFENDTGSSFDMKADASQSTDAPDGFSNSLKLACDGVSAVSSTSNGMITTFLEGQDVQDLAFGTSNAKSVTLSFYAKSSSQNNGHVYGVFLGAYLNGTRNAQTRGFTVTSSWQRFTMTFAGTGTATSTAINNDNLKGFQIGFSLACGSNDQVSYSTWTAESNLLGFTGQDNFFDNTSNEIYITGVQLEVGTVATDFEHRSFAQELDLCERYCQVLVQGSQYFGTCMLYTSSTHTSAFLWKKTMRSTPTIVANSGGNYYITYRNSGSVSYDSLSGSISLGNQHGGGVYTTSGSGTQGHAGTMGGANANTFVYIEAEL